MSGYSDFTTRSIKSVTELKPGDHIRTGNKSSNSFSTVPASTTPHGPKSRSRHESEELAEPEYPEIYASMSSTHHLLVVKVVKGRFVEVIHKVKKHNIIRELKWYRPEDITVLDYESTYTGEYAVKRAKDMMKRGEEFHGPKANCEHFVTEVRTGEKQCFQIRHATAAGVVGGGVGAVGGAAGGAGLGALIGAGIGSVIPVAGTIAGGVIGGFIGGIIGGVTGGAAGGAGGAVGGIKLANRVIED